jgi:peptidoglycan/xylan/chitin deacetylase (PgdA/CDA1 family)
MNLIDTLQNITKQKILLPFYHTVAEQPLPHIKHLYRMKTVTEFQKDLNFLLKNFDPIDAETLYHFHINKIVPEKTVFHLTFDDGLKEIYEIVAPILFQKGVSATFFVNSGFVDNKALFYRHQESLEMECFRGKRDNCDNFLLPQQVDEFLKNEKPYMTTAQIQELSRRGFTIGAHSVDHPYYDQISWDEQLRQTRESLDFVSSIVNQKLRLFAFPFTDFKVSKDFFEAIKPDIDLSFGTAGLKKDGTSFNLQRIAAEHKRYSPLKFILRKEYLKNLVRTLLDVQR